MTVKPLARLSPAARTWLLGEIDYLAARNPDAAAKVAALFRAARQRLTDHPNIAAAGQIPGTRRLVLKSYVLTIRQRDGTLEIVAIRHARQGDAYAPADAMDKD